MRTMPVCVTGVISVASVHFIHGIPDSVNAALPRYPVPSPL